jgi:hypothetical protein
MGKDFMQKFFCAWYDCHINSSYIDSEACPYSRILSQRLLGTAKIFAVADNCLLSTENENAMCKGLGHVRK